MLIKLKLNTTDRMNGESYNARIPIQTSITHPEDIVYGKLESTTPIVLDSLKGLYLVSGDISQTNSYDTNKTNGLDNQVLGIVPFIGMNGSNYIYQAGANHNDWFEVETPSKLTSSIINLSVVDGDGNIVSGVGEYSVMFAFREI